jgi:hypothetical protein
VRDDDHGGVELLLEPVDQVEDLGLDRHVERRGRLVGDQQVGVQDRPWRSWPAGACRPRTRAGTAWPLVRLRDPHPAEHVHGHAWPPSFEVFWWAGWPPRSGRPPCRRVQRGHGVLEDHAHLLAPDVAHLVRRELQQVLALEQDLPSTLRPAWCVTRPMTVRKSRSCRSPDSPPRRASRPGRRGTTAVHGLDHAVAVGKWTLRSLDLEQRLAGSSSLAGWRPGAPPRWAPSL